MDTPRISPASLRWHDDQPFSERFGDIYHAPDGGAEVGRVFLGPAGVAERAARLPAFRIGETGFGSGLNFVIAAEACLAAGTTLHFVSFEGAPIAPAEFDGLARRRAHANPLYAELARAYPPLVRGWHQRHLAGGRIRLTLFWGDALAGLDEFGARQRLPMDAWFLDGFAPDRNPELWSDALFASIARLSGAATTVTTFTSAGRVRRGLEQVGFAMRRVDQRPHKRESLAGTFAGSAPASFSPPRAATVIGAGLAGASLARHLAEAGLKVTVHDPRPPATGAPAPAPAATEPAAPGSALPTTVLHGRLLADPGTAGSLRCHGFLYAAAWASRFAGFTATGVLQRAAGTADAESVATDPPQPGADRLGAIAATWGDTGPWLEQVSTTRAEQLSAWPIGAGGLWFANAGIIDTPQFCQALLNHPDIELVPAAWNLAGAAAGHEQPLILACGMATLDAPAARYLELAPVYGQLDFVTAAQLPRVPIVGSGYLVPGPDLLAIGATYEYRPWAIEAATRANLAQLNGHGWSWQFRHRGVRATSSDRIAVAGPLYDEDGQSLAPLYVSTGHGSMGNVSSHFAAALIAAEICGVAPPMSPSLATALSPLRFRLRQRRRGYRHGARD